MQNPNEPKKTDGTQRNVQVSARRVRIDRFLRALFFGIALVLIALAVIMAWELHSARLQVLRAKSPWGALAAAVFFALAGWKLSLQAKFRILLLLLTLALVESVLQAASWLGVLPAVNTKERVPFGRVYWTSEGLGNSIRNRYGWHYPEFDLQTSNRVGIIGDSFVEAVEVNRSKNLSAQLDEKWRDDRDTRRVFGFGNHGTGPAHYLEVLQYAYQYFAISEAVLVIYLGNDITDCSPKLTSYNQDRFIFYSFSPKNSLYLNATEEHKRASFRRGLEATHRPVWISIPRILVSHCMCLQLPRSIRATRAQRKIAARQGAQSTDLTTKLSQLGLKAAPFAVAPSAETQEAMAIMTALLDRAAVFAREKGIRLRLVTVPFFPPDFYAQRGREWSASVGEYDFLAPERTLADYAMKRELPFLGLGERMRRRGLTPEEIRTFYLSEGSGHFSEAGHRFTAEQLNEAFFASKPQ